MNGLTKKDQPDRSKINLRAPLEVKHWCKKLGVDKPQLRETVEKVGDSAAAVRKELTLSGAELQAEPGAKRI